MSEDESEKSKQPYPDSMGYLCKIFVAHDSTLVLTQPTEVVNLERFRKLPP